MNPYSYVKSIKPKPPTGAQEALERAMLELYAKNGQAVSVKTLCEKASVARSTFYAYYDVVDDCLRTAEDRLIERLISMNEELMRDGELNDFDFFRGPMYYVKENIEYFRILLVERPDYRFIEKWKDGIKYHMYARMRASGSEKNRELTLEMIASEAIAAYTYWMKNHYDIDFEYVKKLMQRTISAYTQQN